MLAKARSTYSRQVVGRRTAGLDERLLAISQHLDDAVFLVGGTLAHHAHPGWRVVVATVFTASVPDPHDSALACRSDKGRRAEVDDMALRRAEDEAACGGVNGEAVHRPLAEAPHRGYHSAPALFAGRTAGWRPSWPPLSWTS